MKEKGSGKRRMDEDNEVIRLFGSMNRKLQQLGGNGFVIHGNGIGQNIEMLRTWKKFAGSELWLV